MVQRLRLGGTIYTAGNGGSAANSQHLAAELIGRLSPDRERNPISARSLAADVPSITALANDYGHQMIFARQLKAYAKRHDLLVVLSTSGRSPNLIEARKTANELQVHTLGLLGPPGSPLDSCNDVINVDANDPGTIQEVHLFLTHTIVRAIEDRLAE
jgi:D-sedoheptulose 7-phosphate isomerase